MRLTIYADHTDTYDYDVKRTPIYDGNIEDLQHQLNSDIVSVTGRFVQPPAMMDMLQQAAVQKLMHSASVGQNADTSNVVSLHPENDE